MGKDGRGCFTLTFPLQASEAQMVAGVCRFSVNLGANAVQIRRAPGLNCVPSRASLMVE